VFNSLKADCSPSYLLATPPAVEQMPRLAALRVAYSSLATASCTLYSPFTDAPFSCSQYLARCVDGGILSEVALESSRLTR
jgi:hypothetical protein